ncbi:hypothetical protein Acr_23g0011700 [Actinidia rufa]|uniref:Uncharacterized protein n=1 Tax=Actinidia rufa TaxID=165716 RepID=A0A7J0GPP2_9ERIC|nr:hypothetical protein Acr_23g0011700 [Actinidia rufa]
MSRSDERRRRVCAEDSTGVEDITKLARLLLPDLRSGSSEARLSVTQVLSYGGLGFLSPLFSGNSDLGICDLVDFANFPFLGSGFCHFWFWDRFGHGGDLVAVLGGPAVHVWASDQFLDAAHLMPCSSQDVSQAEYLSYCIGGLYYDAAAIKYAYAVALHVYLLT